MLYTVFSFLIKSFNDTWLAPVPIYASPSMYILPCPIDTVSLFESSPYMVMLFVVTAIILERLFLFAPFPIVNIYDESALL